MNKRKPVTGASKRAHSPKIAAKALQAKHAVVRSPKDRRSSLATALNNSQEAPDQFDFFPGRVNLQAQAKLLEMAQANLQFALECAQRLATMRSPFDIFNVMAELTNKRIAMFGKHSKELTEIAAMR